MNSEQKQQGKRDLRNFGLVTGAMITLIFGLALPWLFDRAYPAWPWITAGVLWTMALVVPALLRPVFKAWMTLGHWLGWLNTRIILGVMFYTVFLFFGLIMKMMGKDPMARKFDRAVRSYRVPSQARPKDHVERPF